MSFYITYKKPKTEDHIIHVLCCLHISVCAFEESNYFQNIKT